MKFYDRTWAIRDDSHTPPGTTFVHIVKEFAWPGRFYRVVETMTGRTLCKELFYRECMGWIRKRKEEAQCEKPT